MPRDIQSVPGRDQQQLPVLPTVTVPDDFGWVLEGADEMTPQARSESLQAQARLAWNSQAEVCAVCSKEIASGEQRVWCGDKEGVQVEGFVQPLHRECFRLGGARWSPTVGPYQ